MTYARKMGQMTTKYNEDFTAEDFSRILGETDELPKQCLDIIDRYNLKYKILKEAERDQVILRILTDMDVELPISGPRRLPQWEQGWGENLDAYVGSGHDSSSLIPGYYQRGQTVMRIEGKFILPEEPLFEYHSFEVIQAWLASTFIDHVDTVYEFGCGPAHNLLAFASIYPKKKYFGLDWAIPSQKIITEIRKKKGFNIEGLRFDMFHPETAPVIEAGSAVFTIGAMEQLGNSYEGFFEYLLNQDADTYVHIEPIIEMHPRDTLIGYLGAKYMEKRGYLNGYLDMLYSYEKEGKITITHCRPVMGSTYCIGWCLIAWKK
jgi:hypothetical protein